MFALTSIRRQYAAVFLRVANYLATNSEYRFGLCFHVTSGQYRDDCPDVQDDTLYPIIDRHAPAYVRLEDLAYWVGKVPGRLHYREDHAEWRAAKCREIAAAVLAGKHDDVIGTDDPPEVGIDIWPYVTRQYLYDTGCLAILKQGRRCTKGGGCVYTNPQGHHCIVGHIMNPKDHAEVGVAGWNEGTGIGMLLHALGMVLPLETRLLLEDMQTEHDMNTPENGWPSIRSRLVGLGMRHGLSTQKVMNYA